MRASASIVIDSPFPQGVCPELRGRTEEGLESLTPHERIVLAFMCHGLTADGIAAKKGSSVETVRTQVRRLLSKLGVSNNVAAVALAIQYGGYSSTVEEIFSAADRFA